MERFNLNLCQTQTSCKTQNLWSTHNLWSTQNLCQTQNLWSTQYLWHDALCANNVPAWEGLVRVANARVTRRPNSLASFFTAARQLVSEVESYFSSD